MTGVFITGAAGFLGSQLARVLHNQGYKLVCADLANASRARLDDMANFAWVEFDLGNPENVSACLERVRPQAIVHCAAYGVDYRQQDLEPALATNVAGTAALVSAAAGVGVQRFIHVGTCFEYGDKPRPISEQEVLDPISLYGVTKAAGTLLALERARTLGLSLTVVRPFSMYGPQEGGHKLVPQIMKACEAGQTLPLTLGEQVRDYTFVGDVAEAIAHMLNASSFPAGEIFNLGSGHPIRLRDFVTTCARAFGGETLMDFGAVAYRPNEMWHLVADTAKWQQYYGRTLSRTTIEQGCNLMREQDGQSAPTGMAGPGTNTS